MKLYRVIGWDDSADEGESGHPLFVDVSRQGAGRADNPRHYAALYVSESPQGAVGEVFGDLAVWNENMFDTPWLPDGVRALATFEAEPPPDVLDLDDAHVLVELNAKPTDVVGRDRERTQELALEIWMRGQWAGIRWWSWWRPTWRNQILWSAVDAPRTWPLALVDVEPLAIDHAAVRVAGDVLRRPVSPDAPRR